MRRHPSPRRAALAVTAALVLALLGTGEARASGTVCDRVEDGLFDVDGMLDDWRGFRGRVLASSSDTGMVVRCAYDAARLYLSVNLRDDRLVRTRRARVRAEDRVEDRVEVRLDAGGKAITFDYLPGSETAGPKLRAPRFVTAADSLQPQGWSLELSVPLAKVPGWARTVPYLGARIAYHDVDQRGRVDRVVALDGRLHFSAAAATYRAFLRAAGLRPRDVRIDVLADVDPGKGVERVIAGKNVVGVLSDGFSFMRLPVASPRDILDLRVVDLGGAGRSAIVGHVRQHGNGGSRELVAVWFAAGDGSFQQAIAFEVAKEMGGRSLRSEWVLVPRGLHRGSAKRRRAEKKGLDILVKAAEAEGFDDQSFREIPAPDVRPILLPWGDRAAELHYFEGATAYTEEDPRL